jgi:hypothetical protein
MPAARSAPARPFAMTAPKETASDLIGYTIVEADDLAAAKAFTDGLPFLSDNDGKRAIEVFELLPM